MRDDLDHLKSGSVLCKLRDKGLLGLKIYRRKYRLNIADLEITYSPNKGLQKSGCVGGAGGRVITIQTFTRKNPSRVFL